MKYRRFEDLPCWNAAVELVTGVYALTRDRCFRQSGDLADQLRRAALSVSNNIAEGFERGSTSELLAFLYIARGSAGEVRSMLHVLDRLGDVAHLGTQIADLRAAAENCSRQIRGWANSLQNTDIQGPRHLNDRTRRDYDRKRSLAEFELQNARRLHQIHPDIFPDPDAAPDATE